MKSKISVLLILIVCIPLFSFSQENGHDYAFDNYHRYYREAKKIRDTKKEMAIENFRRYYSQTPYASTNLSPVRMLSGKECLALLDDDGRFTDYRTREEEVKKNNYAQSPKHRHQEFMGNLLYDAFNRIWKIAESYRSGELTSQEAFTDTYCKAILYYGNLEISRSNDVFRFHSSCFGIPTAAVNTYLYFLDEMNEVESGKCVDQQKINVCDMLKVLALQAWTQPLRGDFTDSNVVQIERFRKHVWWVGGNAVGYRSLFLCALLYKSIPMIDLLAEVCRKSISTVSQNTCDDAFWNEGFTEDGAGWGHGRQCLVWRYPIDGTRDAMKLLKVLYQSPWKQELDKENTKALLNFFRGGSWYHYKGYMPPCIDRYSTVFYEEKNSIIPYYGMLDEVVNGWINSFTSEEQNELKQLRDEAKVKAIDMQGYPLGVYSGTRWFFNNDDLIKKNEKYYIFVNMASSRCDGLESAVNLADEYNFFVNDGLTFFQRKGDEYLKVNGAWDVTASPGITAREGMDRLVPVTNWRGYNSRYNFAGAATRGGENAVAGFIYEKRCGANENDNNPDNEFYKKNPWIYNVLAYKSYFMMGDYLIALGAGITNLEPGMQGTIRTTIDQTAHVGKVYRIWGSEKQSVAPGTQSFIEKGKNVWVAQDGGFAYTVLPGETKKAYYTIETKKNEWNKRNIVNKNKTNLPEEADILRLWVDHGRTSQDDTYGYVVYCGTEQPQKNLPFTVLRNDKSIQAILSSDKKIIEAVFYNPQEMLKAKGLALGISHPAIVLVEDIGDEYIISVNDPQMLPELKQIDILFNKENIKIDMPQGKLCGKPVSVHVKK